jgi:hypothetical protein
MGTLPHMPAGEMLILLIPNPLEPCKPVTSGGAFPLGVLGVQASGQLLARGVPRATLTLLPAQPSQYRDQATPYFPFWATSVII